MSLNLALMGGGSNITSSSVGGGGGGHTIKCQIFSGGLHFCKMALASEGC